MYYFRVSSEIRVARTSETKEMAAMTAFNIFVKKCREEHKFMFPEEQLGKPRHVSIVTVFFTDKMFKTTGFLQRNVLRGGEG